MAAQFVLPGKVYLVGAGPGSAKMLTLRAAELLRQADVVLHDDLVSAEVLALIPAHTAVHNVGKRCGFKRATQEEIQRRMIAAAQAGQSVVRLKGGDPLIFGRTGEEIRALRENGIEFEIVPGITAATAAAAAAQIPLTDRDCASKLVIVTNHPSPEKDSRDWHRSISRDATLVFYMPGGNFAPLREELRASGLDLDTPCLLVSRASQAGQTMLRTSLRWLAETEAIPAPAVLIVGAAVAGANAEEWTPAVIPAQDSFGITQEISLSLDESKAVDENAFAL